jgi:deazaflavin-dependent oxidoreductase (nitroreductase family)
VTFSTREIEERFRRGFKHFNPVMVAAYRLGLARWLQPWPRVTGRILVLVHSGRRSGRRYTTPLNFARVDGAIHVLAGFGERTDWYRNLLADPRVEVWLPEGWWEGTATDVSEHPNRRRLLRAVLVGSGLAAHLFGVSPRLPDERLDEITTDYRLVRIDTTAARSGSGGPGGLSWVWPAAAVLLLRRRMARRRP